MANITTLFASLQRGFLKNVLGGAGLTLGVAGISLIAINEAMTFFKNSLSAVPAGVLQLAGIVGIDVYISLVFGAIVTHHIKTSSSLSLLKKNN